MKSEKDLSLLEKIKSELPEGANPTEWEQLLLRRLKEEIKVHRFLDCPHYKRCLDYASRARWQGWSCHWCNLKVEEKEERNPYGKENIYERLDKAIIELDKLKDEK